MRYAGFNDPHLCKKLGELPSVTVILNSTTPAITHQGGDIFTLLQHLRFVRAVWSERDVRIQRPGDSVTIVRF